MKPIIIIAITLVLLVPISAIANASEPEYVAFEKPLKQIMHGTLPKDISCNNDLVLILRYSDGSPACVKPFTAPKLVERGWGIIPPPCCKHADVSFDLDTASSYMDPLKLNLLLDDFRNILYTSQDIDKVFFKFGDPSDDIGSGIHIYVYELKDSTQIWIGYTDKILYVQHADVEGNVLEKLFQNVSNDISYQKCSGTARCITGTVTSVIDGDTIKVDGQSIRFALASAPELNESGGDTAKEFIEEICPVGSIATVDEDDLQTKGSYGRIIGVIHCNSVNLNEELLDAGLGDIFLEFCSASEFANDSWAVKHECNQVPKVTTSDCDPSYPDFCIPASPPDLDCKDIPQKKFTVLQPDPHRFDADKNSIGCES